MATPALDCKLESLSNWARHVALSEGATPELGRARNRALYTLLDTVTKFVYSPNEQLFNGLVEEMNGYRQARNAEQAHLALIASGEAKR